MDLTRRARHIGVLRRHSWTLGTIRETEVVGRSEGAEGGLGESETLRGREPQTPKTCHTAKPAQATSGAIRGSQVLTKLERRRLSPGPPQDVSPASSLARLWARRKYKENKHLGFGRNEQYKKGESLRHDHRGERRSHHLRVRHYASQRPPRPHCSPDGRRQHRASKSAHPLRIRSVRPQAEERLRKLWRRGPARGHLLEPFDFVAGVPDVFVTRQGQIDVLETELRGDGRLLRGDEYEKDGPAEDRQ